MFPTLRVSFHRLDPTAMYDVSVDMVPVDDNRYRYSYHRSTWTVTGKVTTGTTSAAEETAFSRGGGRRYRLPDCPLEGRVLEAAGGLRAVEFDKLKLTNNARNAGEQV